MEPESVISATGNATGSAPVKAAGATVQGGGGSSERSAVQRASSSSSANSKVRVDHADIVVKAYPVTEDALDSLGTVTRDATVLFTVGGGFLGFSLDLTKDVALALTSGVPATKLAFFAGIGGISWVVGGVAVFFAVLKWIERSAKISAIKQKAIFSKR